MGEDKRKESHSFTEITRCLEGWSVQFLVVLLSPFMTLRPLLVLSPTRVGLSLPSDHPGTLGTCADATLTPTLYRPQPPTPCFTLGPGLTTTKLVKRFPVGPTPESGE